MRTLYLLKLTLMLALPISVIAQKKFHWVGQAGPSITNVHEYLWNENIRYFNPERPFYLLSYHIAAGGEYALNQQWAIRAMLGYEEKGSAHTGFNRELEQLGRFLYLPASALFKPVEKLPFRIELGVVPYYLVQTKSFFSYSTDWELAFTTGLEIHIWEPLSFGVRWVEAVTPIYKRLDVFEEKFDYTNRTQSFQFSVIYKHGSQ